MASGHLWLETPFVKPHAIGNDARHQHHGRGGVAPAGRGFLAPVEHGVSALVARVHAQAPRTIGHRHGPARRDGRDHVGGRGRCQAPQVAVQDVEVGEIA